VRDEAGAVLSLRVLFDDGTMALASVLGGFANPNLRVNRPAASSVLARPGDDLHSLVGQFGTVRLAPGTYRLDRPLVLERAVSLVSESAGPVTLLFEQPASSAPWTAAIKIHAGATTLRGFSIRFAGPVRWDWSVSYGPAVIGTTDDRDPTSGSLKADVRFESLDLESPPAGSAWEEAPRSIRLASAENGVLVNNIIRGGTTEFFRGPWQIEGNDYRGTVPGTYAWSAFAGHDTHDLLLRNNHAEPRGNSGKTWRFLVMTVSGTHDRIIGNTVVGIGPKDSDTIRENAAEIVLTEAYRLRFEGKPLVISGDGRGVRIPTPQGTPVKIGDVLAVVEGSGVGDYARVTQLLDATTLVLDRPIDPYASAVTIAPAFVDYRFEQNVIDSRGSSAAGNLVLVGNHYGSHVQNNTFLGGDGVKITAAPTELPVAWGWSRAPMLELTFADNRIEDARRGGFVAVEHGRPMKSTVGRLYMTARIERNLVRWSQGFRGESDLGLVIGDRDALDPGGFRLELAENSAIWSGPAQPRIKIESAVVNGQILIEQVLLLPPATGFPTPSPGAGSAPGNLMLVNDTGSSASDRVTSDPRLAFDPVPGASGYEYRVGDGVYRSVPNPIAFAPTEISEGPNRVSIRARTATGAVSADSVIDFVLDRLPPAAPLGGRGFADGTIALPALEPGASVEYRLGANAPYTSVGAVASFRPEGLGIGRSSVRVRQVDAAGHSSPEVLIPIRVRRTFARGIWRGQTNVDRVGASSALGPNGVRDVWIRLANLPTDVVVSSVAVEGLGGDSWGWNASPGSWRAALVRRGLARSADLYIHPARNEIGRPFLVTLGYADGTYERFWMAGGRANPSARIALRRVGRRSR
jgi:hypothetical protein